MAAAWPCLWLFVLASLVLNGSIADKTECSYFTNTSCERCLENVSCLWCFSDSSCVKYPVGNIIPPYSVCPLREARWGVCWMNFEFLIIALSIVGGLILLPLICCCCYCCCKKKSRRHIRDEERWAKQQEERKRRGEQLKAERKMKYDEIRRKYGLLQNSEQPYSKFENE